MPDDIADARLVEAVEAGRISDIYSLLASGASPNSRKRVTQRANMVVKPAGFFSSAVLKETCDTAAAESCLSLAVRDGRADVVRVLLSAGADPNSKVQWSVANHFPDGWDEDNRKRRWFPTYSFPSVLVFSLSSGSALFSAPGGHVRMAAPTTLDEKDSAHQRLFLQPKLDIVLALIGFGARPCDQACRLAEKLGPAFQAAIAGSSHSLSRNALTTPPPTPPSSVSMLPEPTLAVVREPLQIPAVARRVVRRTTTMDSSFSSFSRNDNFLASMH
ncbi:hypothetical protein M427DRAFT_58508 [Gonapodya prolifera JEL478]|uniref:Uncharacterized protein n=1 Tax=Gonapodya prolifera (strain JEL478) TaxID=1344416 RepID=A0A139A9M7_GONPJ|nr:hypothetical protein M427DRAFT_58508 [Gonapodya prolifera JEL478]|eukprot:KXS13447.1 hypothetical protein M427DRAFT_58508 [Gonapodya prolifera JEL478]